MKSDKNLIWILSVSALLLLLAVVLLPSRATGEVTMKDADYLVATYPAVNGGDALYIADTRIGLVAVFVYDTARKALEPRDVRRITDAFPN